MRPPPAPGETATPANAPGSCAKVQCLQMLLRVAAYRFSHTSHSNCTRGNDMPDAIWIDRSDELASLARTLESQEAIGLDTEFLRERTFFPKLCLLQLSAAGKIWCVDTLKVGSLEALMPALTTVRASKLIHAARQDL